jgi:hypothetical protein
MMTIIRLFFAHNWPLKIWFVVFISAAMAIAGHDLFNAGVWKNIYTGIFSVCLILLAGVVGFFVSCIFAFFLIPLYSLAAKLNGAPFHENDEVQILIGPHKGKIKKIYEIWSERKQVRVNLGEEEKNAVSDVFHFTEIFKSDKICTVHKTDGST